MYGLRTSPTAWQGHFAGQLQQCGLTRLKSDPNVYADYKHKVYVLVYVDGVLFFGPNDHVHDLVLKLTGELAPGIGDVPRTGTTPPRNARDICQSGRLHRRHPTSPRHDQVQPRNDYGKQFLPTHVGR